MILPETVLQDLRYGVRVLFRNVGFTAVSVLARSVSGSIRAPSPHTKPSWAGLSMRAIPAGWSTSR